MRSLNPDTDSHTIKTGKEGFTLKANQKEENLNGCAAPTKTESEGIDTDIEALETYICDNICQYREKTTSQEALEYYFCSSCEMSKHISKIKAEYDKINSFDHSEAWKLMQKYRKNYALQRMRAKTTSEIRKKHMQNLWHSGRIPGRRRRM